MAEILASEIMAVAGARELRDGEVVVVGLGLPQVACVLAKRTHAPGLSALLEIGVMNMSPIHTAVGLADCRIWYRATCWSGFPITLKPFFLDPLLPAIHALLGGFGRLAGHPRGSQLHSFVYLDVAGATAKVAGQSFFDFVAGRARDFFEQYFRRQENSRRAISALGSTQLGKRLLQWMEFHSVRHTLNGGDVVSFYRDS